jgi:RimJ/RimL family protein N-acetyltransferase
MPTCSTTATRPAPIDTGVQPRRLLAERPWQEHARLYRDLFADPVVAAALWPGANVAAEAERRASEYLAADIAHWQQRSFGPWVFFELGTGVFVGRGGLRACTVEGAECVEVLYAVRSDAWGRGYASEMAATALAEARRLRLAEIVAFAAVSNHASRSVLERIGMRAERRIVRAGLPHVLWRLRVMH